MGQASDSGVPSQSELIALILVASERGQEQAATEMTADISAGHSDTQIPTGEDSFHSGPTCRLLSTSRPCFLWFVDTEYDGGNSQLRGARIIREVNLLA